LALDGQVSHCGELLMLEFARNNDVVLVCIHPHTGRYLQFPKRTLRIPWRGTVMFIRAEYCSVCGKWLHAQFHPKPANFPSLRKISKNLRKS